MWRKKKRRWWKKKKKKKTMKWIEGSVHVNEEWKMFEFVLGENGRLCFEHVDVIDLMWRRR